MTAKEASRLAKKSRDKVQNEDFFDRLMVDVELAAKSGKNSVRTTKRYMTQRTESRLKEAGFSIAPVFVRPTFDKRAGLWHTTALERNLPAEKEWLISW